MIIEDESLIALNLEKILEKKGFEVTGYATMQNNNGTSEGRHLSDIGIGYQAHYQSFFAKAQIAHVIGGEKVESENEHATKFFLQIGYVY